MDKADQENDPDKDISHDLGRQVVGMHCHSPIPEESSQGPGVWSCNRGPMHKRRRSEMSPVGRRLADDMDDEDDFGGPKVTTNPEHDEGKHKQIVQDKVGGNIGGAGD